MNFAKYAILEPSTADHLPTIVVRLETAMATLAGKLSTKNIRNGRQHPRQ